MNWCRISSINCMMQKPVTPNTLWRPFFLNDPTEKNKIPIIAGKVFVVGLEVFRVFSWENTVYIIMS